MALQYPGGSWNSLGSVIYTILAQTKSTTEARSVTPETPGVVSRLWQLWSAQKDDKNDYLKTPP